MRSGSASRSKRRRTRVDQREEVRPGDARRRQEQVPRRRRPRRTSMQRRRARPPRREARVRPRRRPARRRGWRAARGTRGARPTRAARGTGGEGRAPPASPRRAAPASPCGAKLGRRRVEGRADGVVEAAQAREAGGVRDLGHRQRGLLEELAREVGALGERDREGRRPEVLVEEPPQVARGHAEALGERVDARLVQRALVDEAERARHGRRRPERGRRPGRRVRPAAQARPEPLAPAPRRPTGRSARCAGAASAPGSRAGSRSRSSSRR